MFQISGWESLEYSNECGVEDFIVKYSFEFESCGGRLERHSHFKEMYTLYAYI